METIICPFCNGAGCSNCENSGQLDASAEELQQLQALMQTQAPNPYLPVGQNNPQVNPLPYESGNKMIPGSRITVRDIKTSTAGFLALGLLILLAGGAYLSYRYFSNFRPYLAGIMSVIIITLTILLTRSKYLRYQEPIDFLSKMTKTPSSKNIPT